VVSGLGVGTGPAFNTLLGGVLDSRGHLVVCQDSILDIDLSTGARSLISGAGRGNGPTFPSCRDLLILPDGDILADFDTSNFRSVLCRVNPISGDRTVVSTQPTTDISD